MEGRRRKLIERMVAIRKGREEEGGGNGGEWDSPCVKRRGDENATICRSLGESFVCVSLLVPLVFIPPSPSPSFDSQWKWGPLSDREFDPLRFNRSAKKGERDRAGKRVCQYCSYTHTCFSVLLAYIAAKM